MIRQESLRSAQTVYRAAKVVLERGDEKLFWFGSKFGKDGNRRKDGNRHGRSMSTREALHHPPKSLQEIQEAQVRILRDSLKAERDLTTIWQATPQSNEHCCNPLISQ